jgi:hypothetical protein
MTRSEMIIMIMELSQGASQEQTKNNFVYLVCAGHFSGLKRGGGVVTCKKNNYQANRNYNGTAALMPLDS